MRAEEGEHILLQGGVLKPLYAAADNNNNNKKPLYAAADSDV